MARDFQINAQTMVSVKGGAHMSGIAIGALTELGLSVGPIHIAPKFVHKDINCDDFGPIIPAEIMCQLAEVRISMTLIHFDRNALFQCARESMGGGVGNSFLTVGTLAGAGMLLGRNKPVFASGCHFISLNLHTQLTAAPDWRFRSTFLAEPPMEYPVGVDATATILNWRAIPYGVTSQLQVFTKSEIVSSGIKLWDFERDT